VRPVALSFTTPRTSEGTSATSRSQKRPMQHLRQHELQAFRGGLDNGASEITVIRQ